MTRRICVTGANGLAGRAVVRDLLEHGYDVAATNVVARFGEDDVLRADLTDYGQAVEALTGADAVVHSEGPVATQIHSGAPLSGTAVSRQPGELSAMGAVQVRAPRRGSQSGCWSHCMFAFSAASDISSSMTSPVPASQEAQRLKRRLPTARASRARRSGLGDLSPLGLARTVSAPSVSEGPADGPAKG